MACKLPQASDSHWRTLSASHREGLSASPAPGKPPRPSPKPPNQQEATTGIVEQEMRASFSREGTENCRTLRVWPHNPLSYNLMQGSQLRFLDKASGAPRTPEIVYRIRQYSFLERRLVLSINFSKGSFCNSKIRDPSLSCRW